jgi:hypothetical protein
MYASFVIVIAIGNADENRVSKVYEQDDIETTLKQNKGKYTIP